MHEVADCSHMAAIPYHCDTDDRTTKSSYATWLARWWYRCGCYENDEYPFYYIVGNGFLCFGRGSGTEGMEPSPVHRLCFRAQYHGEADAWAIPPRIRLPEFINNIR